MSLPFLPYLPFLSSLLPSISFHLSIMHIYYHTILALNSLHISHKSAFHPSVPFSIVDGFKHCLSLSCNNLGYLHVLHSFSHSPFFPKLSNLSFSSSSLYSVPFHTNVLVIL